jgi:hypothetical protein
MLKPFFKELARKLLGDQQALFYPLLIGVLAAIFLVISLFLVRNGGYKKMTAQQFEESWCLYFFGFTLVLLVVFIVLSCHYFWTN